MHVSPASAARRAVRGHLVSGVAATLLVLSVCMMQAQEPGQLPEAPAAAVDPVRAIVHGIVRNASTGEPLARALVQIEGDANTGTLTDGEGRFEIPAVPVGPQTIRVAKPGFRDRPYATEEASLQAEGPAHSVLVAAQMPELAFALYPNGAIRGRIELSSGDPADGLTLVLLKQVVQFGRLVWTMESSTRTNGEGNYRFGSLPAGVYAVYTLPALESEPAVNVIAAHSGANVDRNGYATMFYPDARDLAGASRIRVDNGSQADANFLLTLEPFYTVTAIGAAETGEPTNKATAFGGFTAVVMDAAGHPLPYTAQYDDATHSLQASLPDGTYTLVVRGFQAPRAVEGGAITFERGGRRAGAVAGSVAFTVSGHALTGLRIPLAPPQTATVHLRLLHNAEGAASPAMTANSAAELVSLNISPAGGIPQSSFESIWSMEMGADSITFAAQPGAYWLSAFLPRKGVCAGAFNAGSFNVAREPLTLSLAAAPPPMEFTLRDDCATLALTLPPTLATFLPGDEPFYTVYLVPDFDTVQDIPPLTMHPSSGATLNLDSLTPGSYHVYVFDSAVHLEYRTPAALAALPNAGQQVTLTAGATANLMLEVPGH